MVTVYFLLVLLLLLLSLLLLLLISRVFFSKLLIIFCNVFLSCPFSQNVAVRYSISSLKYFSEQILAALARNLLNMLVIVSGGIQECGLICTFVRSGLRWTSNSYLPLLFLILMSRKFKHFSWFSSSMVNWMCLSCLFKMFWNSRDCSLDCSVHEYHQHIAYTFLEPSCVWGMRCCGHEGSAPWE